MSFDKTKAMRNAERFLSQGKIRAAIGEYQQVVEHDPKDFSTLNTLGDLYAKNADKSEAVGCFTQVAEHYNAQGFAQKAIAIYNKISRIEPASMEVSAKLAQLYQSKGSIAEARRHYTALAEQYQQKGQKIEALAIWKQIADLDAHNTDIYLKIAETCWQEEQMDEALRAFTEAGFRFLKQENFESALTTFSRALEIKKNDLKALKGAVKAQIGLGDTDEAAQSLEKILEEQPYNRDILYLLVDCYLDMNNPFKAEQTIIRLVEQEPANYPKFLDLVQIYLKSGDLDAATRTLSMSSEHLLVGGQSEEFLAWTNEVLARNPEHLDALRLIIRYYTWQRNEIALRASLERLAETARANNAAEDEQYALSQLVMIAPQEIEYAQRLQELNHAHGFATADYASANGSGAMQYQMGEAAEANQNGVGNFAEYNFADVQSSGGSFEYAAANGNGSNGASNAETDFDFYNPNTAVAENDFPSAADYPPPAAPQQFEAASEEPNNGHHNNSVADQLKLQNELESIEFYVSQGYNDLAAKSLDELEEQFGWRPELAAIRAQLSESAQPPNLETAYEPPPFAAAEEQTFAEPPPAAVEKTIIAENPIAQQPIAEQSAASGFEVFDDLKAELELEDAEAERIASEDYDTHFHLATAYKEMGLMENAIREFQDAVKVIKMNDGTQRFFHCANLLGHCFMEKQMPSLAVLWYKRGLEVEDLDIEQKQALYYELGNAYELSRDIENALAHFGRLYAENVDYRDVSERLHFLQDSLPSE